MYENDLDHIICDDTTNCTIQINKMLDYMLRIQAQIMRFH